MPPGAEVMWYVAIATIQQIQQQHAVLYVLPYLWLKEADVRFFLLAGARNSDIVLTVT